MQIYPIIGLIILISGSLTQLIKIRRTRRVDGISPGAICQLILCCLLFSGYYLGNGHLIALTLNLFLLSISVGILILYCKHRNSPG
jgi:uncharacterized protein with PQ loop repeat